MQGCSVFTRTAFSQNGTNPINLDKAFKYAELSYEKDKQYYTSALDYIMMNYYGQGTSKDRKKAHELMIEYVDRMLEKKSFSEASLDDKWVLSALARDYAQDTYFEQDIKKTNKKRKKHEDRNNDKFEEKLKKGKKARAREKITTAKNHQKQDQRHFEQ